MLHCLFYPVVIDIVGGGLSPQQQVITHVLFDKTVAIMAADDGIGQLDIFNDGLQFAFVLFGDLAAKDDGELVGLTDSAIGIQ